MHKQCSPVKWKNWRYILRSSNTLMLFCADFVQWKDVLGSTEMNHGLLSKIISVFALIQLPISYLIVYLPQANIGSSFFSARNVPGKWKPELKRWSVESSIHSTAMYLLYRFPPPFIRKNKVLQMIHSHQMMTLLTSERKSSQQQKRTNDNTMLSLNT